MSSAKEYKVVVAHCYRSAPDGALVVLECPFCLCEHKHRGDKVTPLPQETVHGSVITYQKGYPLKISDCGKTYAISLRPAHEFIIQPKKCLGTTQKGTPCSRMVRKYHICCIYHLDYEERIIRERIQKLYPVL